MLRHCLDDLGEILLAVLICGAGAQLLAAVARFLLAGGCKDIGAESAVELDCVCRGPARSSMDQAHFRLR